MKTASPTEVVIGGETYVLKSSLPKTTNPATRLKGMPYVVVRTYSAGVHVGYLKKRSGKEVTLVNSRRIWQWDGAASLSQLAMEGVAKPANCKFAMELPTIELTEAIEIIEATEKAKTNIASVPVWKQ